MLRSVFSVGSFRGLASRPFDASGSSCVLGRQSLIYGRNGSGKTSLTEMLRLSALGGLADMAQVQLDVRESGSNKGYAADSETLPLKVLVYNRFYVEASLGLFLDGGSSQPLLKLGEENVEAQTSMSRLRSIIDERIEWGNRLRGAAENLAEQERATEEFVKTSVISHLSAGDGAQYNTSRYRIDKVRALLNGKAGVLLTEHELEHELANASANPMLGVRSKAVPVISGSLYDEIAEVLMREVSATTNPRLRDETALEGWVEGGLALHASGDTCKFCQEGVVSREILASYLSHFSDSLIRVRTDILNARERLASALTDFSEWLDALPADEQLLYDFRVEYRATKAAAVQAYRNFETRATQASQLLDKRLADPLTSISEALAVSRSGDFGLRQCVMINEVLEANNRARSSQANRKGVAQLAVEMHMVASSAPGYKAIVARRSRASRAQQLVNESLRNLRAKLETLQQAQEDTGLLARQIDEDLRAHFGHGHLRVTVSNDRKGYIVSRSGVPAQTLSEGERNAIALCYFLASLQSDDIVAEKTVVVIDDPVTSLDREALFAAYSLLAERTKDMGQVIILTHDYEFFRLQMQFLKGKFESSCKRVKQGDGAEKAFPEVAILEMYGRIDPATTLKQGQLRAMSQKMLSYSSEYHYLFFKIGDALVAKRDEELPLLGNAARRVVEGFLTFKAPHEQNFQAKADDLMRGGFVEPALTRRVIKFLHGHSHRENPNPMTALDFPGVHEELRAVMQFIHAADPSHFDKMCIAVQLDPLQVLV